GLAIDQIAQSGLSSLSVIYYSAQLFSNRIMKGYIPTRIHGALRGSGEHHIFNAFNFFSVEHFIYLLLLGYCFRIVIEHPLIIDTPIIVQKA
ncbi:hypothetical protein, partial [Klebsiella variicola]|uniref:hypothetical protein n=1 Tax=Klebsiella variicola TaxID=244366 RepID=UPI002FF4C4F5